MNPADIVSGQHRYWLILEAAIWVLYRKWKSSIGTSLQHKDTLILLENTNIQKDDDLHIFHLNLVLVPVQQMNHSPRHSNEIWCQTTCSSGAYVLSQRLVLYPTTSAHQWSERFGLRLTSNLHYCLFEPKSARGAVWRSCFTFRLSPCGTSFGCLPRTTSLSPPWKPHPHVSGQLCRGWIKANITLTQPLQEKLYLQYIMIFLPYI